MQYRYCMEPSKGYFVTKSCNKWIVEMCHCDWWDLAVVNVTKMSWPDFSVIAYLCISYTCYLYKHIVEYLSMSSYAGPWSPEFLSSRKILKEILPSQVSQNHFLYISVVTFGYFLLQITSYLLLNSVTSCYINVLLFCYNLLL